MVTVIGTTVAPSRGTRIGESCALESVTSAMDMST